VSGSGYSFPGAEQGKSWTTETIEVAVLPITINGIESGHSPGYLIYWPAAVDPSGYVDPPTSGSSGVYFDVHNDFHTVEFRTTWSVPDFQTVFIWNNTDPFGGPYAAPSPHTPTVGDADTWVAGDQPPGGDTPTGGRA
jgi:hypothetical protein